MRIALKELRRQPGRFASVGGALTLLVVLLVVLGGFLDGLQLGQTGAYRAHEGRLLVFSDDSDLLIQRSRLDGEATSSIEATDQVAAVGELRFIETTAGIGGDGGTGANETESRDLVDVVLIGYDLGTNMVPVPPGPGETVVDQALAELHDVAVGDTIRIGPTSEPLDVVELVDDVSQGSPTLWVPTESWLQLVAAGNPSELPPEGVSQALVVELDDGAEPTTVTEQLGSTPGVEVASVSDVIDALPVVQQQSTVFQGIIGVTFVVTLLVVALFFALITLERVELYAVLKALGARTVDLVSGITAQAVVVSIVALIGGLALSTLFVSLLPADLPVRIEPSRLVQVGVGILLTAVIGSLFTLRRILGIDPAEAIG